VREFALLLVAALLSAALLSAALIVLLRPVLARHAVANPNPRSSHVVPTPQGGGAAVILAALVTIGIFGGLVLDERAALAGLMPLAGAVILLTIVGAVDDMRALAAVPRLFLQAVAVTTAVATLPEELRALPVVPLAAERAAELLAGLWFVNLVNFMDGIDWMTVAETVPVTAAVFAFSLAGAAPPEAGLVALVLCGAMLGFAPFNRPVARLFLGDVGSLPVGLILFWLLVELAGSGRIAAALLLPLYYVADATITLTRRLARGERVTEGHRTHFYQLAVARGVSVMTVVRAVFAVNVVLALLAAATIGAASVTFDLVALASGGAAVAALMAMMWRGRR
jgi:UDP-N-acetylmuramyl pentapeptide phosphotransferase/UDP-N-acetylglucosamine-1-phosphate transferase